MNALLEKYNDYMRLKDCRVEYNLDNGLNLQFIYDEKAFAHLLGLHKLTDLQLIQFWLDEHNRTVKLNDVIKKIKNSTFTDANVKSSMHYHKIQNRYENFNYNNLTTLNYTDAIINFNSTLISSALKSDYLLFEEKGNNQYNHMAIAKDSSGKYRYVESFFHECKRQVLSSKKRKLFSSSFWQIKSSTCLYSTRGIIRGIYY